MRAELLKALAAGGEWTDRFHRKTYSAAFQEYMERFGPLYTEAVQAAGEDLDGLADQLLDDLAAETARQRFWDRSLFRGNAKLTAVQYLSPMLLELEEPACARFAEALQDRWAARWPKDAYGITTYDKLRRSFSNTILGIDVGRLARRQEDEE
ncbi:hypothetical protein [uncultured Dysosmobacter sp.]|uniref:hypothetical protein n=1 Tax=uncultured Dysosmobacter sp. TaxID=2591384 RepID=UPI00261D9428|nr:hypothetical protein [uncultured Dysosmobacter sp.]